MIRGLMLHMPRPFRRKKPTIFKSGNDWMVYWPKHDMSIPFNSFSIAVEHMSFYIGEWTR